MSLCVSECGARNWWPTWEFMAHGKTDIKTVFEAREAGRRSRKKSRAEARRACRLNVLKESPSSKVAKTI